ncbi:hypothetical protein Egran_01788 [Elaphomyces granulatus]|uniref:RING-type domain-containing protein n=1 Tax=Elaphomyces granulatus TaxID=519963 RepID=A0A232M254_9EURO|nr:hypothetical protein Egran_01788 [Elaphomyces granulatus]
MSRHNNKMAAATHISGLDASKSSDCAGLKPSERLQTLQGHIEGIRGLLQCGICVKPLYEPYTLACGHTFCYGCLTSWFGSSRLNKTCPDCRALVKSQPAPAYLVRTLVQMFTSNEELLEKGESTAEHEKHRDEEARRLEADKANTHPRTGGLFHGSFRDLGGRPIYDVEDNVSRCPVCQWELEDDACIRCGYSFGETGTGTETDENSEMTDYLDEIDDGFGDIDDDIVWNETYDGAPFEGLPPNLQQFYHHHHHHAFYWQVSGIHSSDDEDDSDLEDDMDSFIDDGEGGDESGTDRSTVVGDHGVTMGSELDTGSEVSSPDTRDTDSHPDEQDGQEGRGGEAPSVLPMVNGNRPPIAGAGTSARRPSRNHHDHRSNGSDSADQTLCPNHRNGSNQQLSAGSTQTISVDDDSDDDAPIPPTRRGRSRRNRREQSQQ